MMRKSSTKTIVIVAIDGAQILDITGPSEVFSKVERHRPGSYQLVIASPKGGEIVTNSGLALSQTIPLAEIPNTIDTLLIAGGDEAELRTAIFTDGLADWIKNAAPGVRRVGSVCTGAFVLAAAGLLDGRRVTTHWRTCALLQELCPAALVQTNVIYAIDPPIYTSAGITAGIDLALALVEEDLGREIATHIARELVLFIRRPGSQSPFSAALDAQANASDRLQELIVWIVDNLDADLSISSLSKKASMSERNFGRTFKQQVGCTPARFVERVRVEHVCDLLQRSDWPLERVAQRAGFGSIDGLQRAFRRHMGTTPAKYRSDLF